MVSLVAQPVVPLTIFIQCQASKFVSSCQAHCWALSWRASSVGCSSSEDDLLESFEGVSSLGLGWCCFFRTGLDLPSVRLCIGLLVHAKDVANASEGVLGLSMSLPLFTIGHCLAVAQKLSFTFAGLRILILTGGVLLMGEFRFTACFLAIIGGLGLGRA